MCQRQRPQTQAPTFDHHQKSIMDIQLKNQPLDLTFAPQNNVVYTGLMTGEVKAFSFEDDGQHSETFSIRPTKRSCRGLALDSGGTRLFTVSKDKTLQ